MCPRASGDNTGHIEHHWPDQSCREKRGIPNKGAIAQELVVLHMLVQHGLIETTEPGVAFLPRPRRN